MGKLKLFLGASILLLSVQANADITSVDDSVFGPDSVTRDSVSGLDWLDITFTVNRSVADVSGQLGVGGEFEGWRYASGIEFEELLFNYTGVDNAPVYQTEEYSDSDSIDGLIELLGDSVDAYNEFYGLPPSDEFNCGPGPECIGRGYHATTGYLADETPPEYTQLFYTGLVYDLAEGHSSNDYSLSHRIRVHQANQHPAVGSFLVRVSSAPFPVTIDIKPGSDPNSVNPRSKGVIPVAVLGSTDFDATQVDFSTVTFGPDGASPVHDGHVEDVNDDGYPDMVFHFRTQETGIVCGDTEAALTGETFGGIQFTGTDAVKMVGCK